MVAREVIESMYKKVLEATKKEEKINAIKQLQSLLKEEDIVRTWGEIVYDPVTASAESRALLYGSANEMLYEISRFLHKDARYEIVIVTDDSKFREDGGEDEFAKIAKLLGLKVGKFNGEKVAFIELAKNEYAKAYLYFYVDELREDEDQDEDQ